jgi:hypothetical protein
VVRPGGGEFTELGKAAEVFRHVVVRVDLRGFEVRAAPLVAISSPIGSKGSWCFSSGVNCGVSIPIRYCTPVWSSDAQRSAHVAGVVQVVVAARWNGRVGRDVDRLIRNDHHARRRGGRLNTGRFPACGPPRRPDAAGQRSATNRSARSSSRSSVLANS